MRIVRRVLILLVLAANIALFIYAGDIKEPPQEIDVSNVTIVKARDQLEAEEHPAFIREEFVLELPKGENVALGKKADANSFTEVYNPRKAVDGDTGGASYWEGRAEYPHLLSVDLESPVKIHAIRVCLNPNPIWGKRTQTIQVNISDDGENYIELVAKNQYTFDPDTGNQIQINFNEVVTRFVQLEFTENSGAGGGQVAELEIYSK